MHALQDNAVAVMQTRSERYRALVVSLDRDRAQFKGVATVSNHPYSRLFALMKESCHGYRKGLACCAIGCDIERDVGRHTRTDFGTRCPQRQPDPPCAALRVGRR